MNMKQCFHQYLDNPSLFNFVRDMLDGGRIEHISRILAGIPHKRVVDIACGTGDVSRAVRADVEYVGIDISESFIAYAESRYGGPQRKFMVMDVANIRLPRKSFDLAMLVSVIHHFNDQEVIQMFMQASELTTDYILVIDAIPRRNLISRLFYALDRGAHFRTLGDQRSLVNDTKYLQLVLEDSFESTSKIYTHSVLLGRLTNGGS